MIGIKITDLPSTSLPYSGSEEIALVQNNETRTGSIGSLTGYLSSVIVTPTTIQTVLSSDPGGARTAAKAVGSVTTGISGAMAISNIVSISQSNYNALTAKDNTTLYVIISS